MPPKRKREASRIEKRPRFGRLPERGVSDKRLWRTRHGMHARVLYACSIHADAAGLFCVSSQKIADLVGLKYASSALSYLRDLEVWGYLRRVGTITHPEKKLYREAAKVFQPGAPRPPRYLKDLIVRQMIIRPGEDERDNAAKIPARRRVDEEHRIVLPEAEVPEPTTLPRPIYSHRSVVAEKISIVEKPPRGNPTVVSIGSGLDFSVFD